MSAEGAAGEERLRALLAINRAIGECLEYDEVLRRAVEGAAAFTDARACLLLMGDADGTARIAAATGVPRAHSDLFRGPLDEHIEARLRTFFPAECGARIRCLALDAGRQRGLLALCAAKPGGDGAGHALLLQALADQIAVALDRAARYGELRRDLRSRELLTEQVFERAPLGIYALTPDLAVEEVNTAGAEFVGRSEDAIVGRTLEEVLPDPSGHVSGCCRMILAGDYESVSGIQVHINPRRGLAERYLDVSLVPGAPNGVLLLAWDITERVRAERRQELHAEQLAEANEAKDLFFNTLSHELRTPLAAMTNSLAVLDLEGATEEQRRSAWQIMERNVRSQTKLVDDLLDLSRIMRGKLKLQRESLDLCELAATLARELESEVHTAGLTLVVRSASAPLLVSADPLRLRQIISNLLVNAVKYTNPGGRIVLTTAAEGGQAVLRVRDTGVGISAKLMRHLFEPFRQAEHAGARSRGGLGIGLSVARALTEQHGGVLAATSAGANQGSEFILRLALTEPGGAESERASADAGHLSRRILVVEDDADVRDSLVALLEVLGHRVFACADGHRALETAAREHPDIGLVDLGMPFPDGYEVARRLRAAEATRGMYLVAVTGYGGEEHVRQASAAGFDAHVTKPVPAERLVELLARAGWAEAAANGP